MASDEYQRQREAQPSADARVYLWRSVISQAFLDATETLSPSAAKLRSVRLNRLRCREWFTLPNRDFEEVCGLAGLEPSRVRAHAIPRIEAAARLDPPMLEPAPRRPRVRNIRTTDQRQAESIAQ